MKKLTQQTTKFYLALSILFLTFSSYAQDVRVKSKQAPSIADVGQKIAIRTDLMNYGTQSAPSFTMYYYINNVNYLNGNEIPLHYYYNGTPSGYSDVVRALGPGDEDDENHWPNIPSNLVSGTYYIIWHLDLNDQNNSNNIVSKAITINGIPEPKPDLEVVGNVSSTYIDEKQSFTLQYATLNTNDQATSPSSTNVKVWWSINTSISSSSDVLAKTISNSTVQSGNSFDWFTTSITAPDLSSFNLDGIGSYNLYLLLEVDYNNDIDEGNKEGNNVFDEILITVRETSTGGRCCILKPIDDEPRLADEPQYLIETYPNPTVDQINIKLQNTISSRTIVIRNSSGLKVYEGYLADGESEKNIDFFNQAKGLYFVEIHSKDDKIVKRILKE